jgi:hypothetical protein
MKYVLFLLLFLSGAVCWGRQPLGVTVQGTLLYIVPSFDEIYFVINGAGSDGNGNPTPKGYRINNPGSFTPGFRLDGRIHFNPCFNCGVRWSHLFSTTQESVTNKKSPPQLWPTENIPSLPSVPSPFSGRASSRIGIMYNKAEILCDEEICHFGCCHLTLREAIEWSYIRYHETVKYCPITSPPETIQYHAHTKGIGPQFGLILFSLPGETLTWFPQCLGFRVMSTASLIVANSKAKLVSEDLLGAINPVTQLSFWKLLPEWNITFGINYNYCYSCFALNFEIGYEMTTYVRGISKLIFDDATDPGHSFNQYSDFYLHGAFLSCRLFF